MCRRRLDSAASLAPPGFRLRRAVTAAAASRARPSPGTPRRRLHAGEPSPPRRLHAPMSRRRAARAPPPEAELGQRRARGPRALRPAEAMARVATGRARALCDWAEREFGPVHPVKFY
jgi:hypothetical protein